jgi:Spy/CpxP family protein refolding chaperone
MKRKLMTALMLTALMTTGAAHAMGPGGPPHKGGGPDLTRLATVLKLTEAQQTRIRGIQEAEQTKAKPLLDALKEKRDQLRTAGERTTFDEGAVTALATAVAQKEAELTVARIKARTQISALLTAEQRETLKSLRPKRDRRPPPSPDNDEE